MNKVTGAWLIAFLPSYGLYLFLLSPFNFKSFKIIGTIISIVLMLLADIFPIILLVKYKDVLLLIKEGEMFGLFSSFTFLLISIIISEIGIISLSLLSLVSFNPDKIKNKKNNYNSKLKEPFYIFIFKLLIGIIIGLFNSSLALIRLKEKHINIYSVLIILICSYLCCVLSEILMILFVIFIIGFVIMIMAKMYNMGSQSQTKREVKAKFSNGKEITLTQTIATDVWYDNKNHRWKEEGLGNFTRID